MSNRDHFTRLSLSHDLIRRKFVVTGIDDHTGETRVLKRYQTQKKAEQFMEEFKMLRRLKAEAREARQ